MKWRKPFAAVLAPMFIAYGAACAGEATPLFSEDSVVSIRIEGPINALVRAADKSTDPYPATLVHDGVSYPIELSARGNSRRREEVCQFPPLRVNFEGKPDAASLFDGQNKLKLVTHCRSREAHQQYVLREMAAYRILNVLTSASLRVRPLRVVYFDTEKGKEVASRAGFFIEDIDDMARRIDMKEVERPTVPLQALDADALGLIAVYQYMIGNLDWSAVDGHGEGDCCHNGKLVGLSKDAAAALVYVPYDFDYSGLVDAPYALPPEGLRVRNVRTRLYRGFCAHNGAAREAAAKARAARGDIMAIFEGIAGIDAKSAEKARDYLDDFFEDIVDEASVEKNLLRDCRD